MHLSSFTYTSVPAVHFKTSFVLHEILHYYLLNPTYLFGTLISSTGIDPKPAL